MSKTYRVSGARFLRKYTADELSSIQAYMADARRIADSLCKVPWTRAATKVPATMTLHTEEGLDWNATERDRFDAAEWCAEHAGGMHRAFAQAACYVFKLPSTAIGTNIEKIGVTVTSDPYNPYGARISALTSNTLDIPMDCATVRTGDVYRQPDSNGLGAAPRLYVTNPNGTQTWYANTESVELQPSAALAAKQYLFVFVCLENYSRGRDGWIEGSSFIENNVALTLADTCQDLDEDIVNDLSEVSDLKWELVDFPESRNSFLLNNSTAVVRTLALSPVGENVDAIAETKPVKDYDYESSVIFSFGGVDVSNGINAESPYDDVSLSDLMSGVKCFSNNILPVHDIYGEHALRWYQIIAAGLPASVDTFHFKSGSGNVYTPRFYLLCPDFTIDASATKKIGVLSGSLKIHGVSSEEIVNDWQTMRYVGIKPANLISNSLLYDRFDSVTGTMDKAVADLNEDRTNGGLIIELQAKNRVYSAVPTVFRSEWGGADSIMPTPAAGSDRANLVDPNGSPDMAIFYRYQYTKTKVKGDIVALCCGRDVVQFNNKVYCNAFTTEEDHCIDVEGVITSITCESFPKMEGSDYYQAILVISGKLQSVGSVSVRNCAVIKVVQTDVNAFSLTISKPEWDDSITPDDYTDFSVSPTAALLVGHTGKYIKNDRYTVSGRFAKLSGRDISICAEINEIGAISQRVLMDANEVNLKWLARYLEFPGRPVDPVEDFVKDIDVCTTRMFLAIGGQSTPKSDLGLGGANDIYGKQLSALSLYAGFAKGHFVGLPDSGGLSERIYPSFVVNRDNAVKGCTRITMTSMFLPLAVPHAASAKKLLLNFADNSSAVVNDDGRYTVWIKNDVFTNLPQDDILDNPDIYIGKKREVDGWKRVGELSVLLSGNYVFDIDGLMTSQRATVLITAYLDEYLYQKWTESTSLDGNPEFPQGSTNADKIGVGTGLLIDPQNISSERVGNYHAHFPLSGIYVAYED